MFKLTTLFALLVVMIAPIRSGCPGCVLYLKGERLHEAESVLSISLSKLAATGGPYYRLAKVNAATKQIVAGIKHVISAELIDDDDYKKTCKVTIWSKPWLPNGTEVCFECPGEEKITRRYGS